MKDLVASYFGSAPGETFCIGAYRFVSAEENGVLLYAPEAYWKLTTEDKKHMGCGPGKWGDRAVPDSILGLDIKPACSIHDVCYAEGRTDEDKVIADILFLMNMLSIVHTKSWPVLRQIRSHQALTYYLVVEEYGESSFRHGKEIS